MKERDITGIDSALYRPIPNENLCDDLNSQIVQSEIEGGVQLSDLAPGTRLEVKTEHTVYQIVTLGEGRVEISGHPRYCPTPTEVVVRGSSWGGSLLKASYLGRGMRLEFWHPKHELVTTSKIVDIRQLG